MSMSDEGVRGEDFRILRDCENCTSRLGFGPSNIDIQVFLGKCGALDLWWKFIKS